MPATVVIGLDLSGPSNTKDTAALIAEQTGTGLQVRDCFLGLSDSDILDLRRSVHGKACVFAIDAPLSYNPGGGDRPADKDLRRRIIAAGLASGSIMPPTMTRMAYLTLRGIAVARMLLAEAPDTRIVEVHPGAAMVLRGAAPALVRGFSKELSARERLIGWLRSQGMTGLGDDVAATSHQVAAAAAALAGSSWIAGHPAWHWPADGSVHPFDFAC